MKKDLDMEWSLLSCRFLDPHLGITAPVIFRESKCLTSTVVILFIIRLSGTYCFERDTSPRTSWENLQDASQGTEESFQGLRPLPLPPFLEKNAKCSFLLQIQPYAPLSTGGALPSCYFNKPGCALQFP